MFDPNGTDLVEKLKTLVISTGGRSHSTREADMKMIARGERSKDPTERRQAQIAKSRINSETGAIRSMRESLVKAHRDGNKAEIADIHSIVERKPMKYKNQIKTP